MSRDAVLARLAELEAGALRVYAAHDLPTRPGHYRRGPRAGRWTWLGTDLPPEARWAEVLARPPEKGWRHAALADLGARDGRPGAVAASETLKAVGRLRARLTSGEPLTPEDLLDALTLGPAPDGGGKPRARRRSPA